MNGEDVRNRIFQLLADDSEKDGIRMIVAVSKKYKGKTMDDIPDAEYHRNRLHNDKEIYAAGLPSYAAIYCMMNKLREPGYIEKFVEMVEFVEREYNFVTEDILADEYRLPIQIDKLVYHKSDTDPMPGERPRDFLKDGETYQVDYISDYTRFRSCPMVYLKDFPYKPFKIWYFGGK